MKKFTKWLIDNGFIITSEYDIFLNRMNFQRNNIIFILCAVYKKPRYQGDPKYTGETISYYNIHECNNDKYNTKGRCVASGKTQKELIENFQRYLNKK